MTTKARGATLLLTEYRFVGPLEDVQNVAEVLNGAATSIAFRWGVAVVGGSHAMRGDRGSAMSRLTDEQQDIATPWDIYQAFDRHTDAFLTALDADPWTTGIPAYVEVTTFTDDGLVLHRTEASIGRGGQFHRQARTDLPATDPA